MKAIDYSLFLICQIRGVVMLGCWWGICLFFAVSSYADGPSSVTLLSGVDYSQGDYADSEPTKILDFPFGVKYARGNLSAKVTGAWLQIDGPGNVIGDGSVIPGTGGSRTESGWGDLWIEVGYELDAFPPEWGFIDVGCKVKIPTADENKGLGTGESDQALLLDYMFSMGAITPFLSGAYKFMGDPDGVDFNNVFSLSVGADWRYSESTHIGASLDFQQASTNGVDDPLELFSYLNHKINNRWSLTPYLYLGMSDSSPDMGGGLQLSYKRVKGVSHESTTL